MKNQTETTMKTLTVKYHHGRTTYDRFGASASQVQQVLEQLQPELVELCGNYTWSLDGDTFSGYAVVATSGKNRFTESTGKTPGAALRGFYGARKILQRNYNGNWA